MISLSPVISLLQNQPNGFWHLWFRDVAGAAEIGRIPNDGANLPACWVVRATEKSRHMGEREELVTVGFDVVIGIDNTRTERAGETDDVLLAYRQAVKTALLGYEFDGQTQPVNFAGGNVMRYSENDLFWSDRYEVTVLIDNYLPDPPKYDGLICKNME